MRGKVRLETLGRPVLVLDAVRTPVGRYRGILSHIRPDDLAATVIKKLIDRNPDLVGLGVDDVVFGAANQAGEDNRNVARMAALLAGLGVETPGVTVNRLCGSSLEALLSGYRQIALGEAECVIVGGVESMSRAPFVIARPDSALPRSLDLVDTTIGWRLVNAQMPKEWTISLGATAENVAEMFAISREAQDRFAFESHRRAIQALDDGVFTAEIAPVLARSGGEIFLDEGPRRETTLGALGALAPVFRKGGSVTAGNSSPLNDGAAALVLVSESFAKRLERSPLARVLGGAVAGITPDLMGLGPVPSTERLLERLSIGLDDFGAIEINEAFAAQVIGVAQKLALDIGDPRLNGLGGALAIGHPLGASGARIATTLLYRMHREDVGLGFATMCIGVGQGISVAFERSENL
ncbi:MAG TPA: acetyl-CoA C-acyltransferase [Acidimicrobiales bacterium]|nr:acetyl-CoA C-acyltransferase [Acidimicrobiales bacterium]